jgi:hypothetical protein
MIVCGFLIGAAPEDHIVCTSDLINASVCQLSIRNPVPTYSWAGGLIFDSESPTIDIAYPLARRNRFSTKIPFKPGTFRNGRAILRPSRKVGYLASIGRFWPFLGPLFWHLGAGCLMKLRE